MTSVTDPTIPSPAKIMLIGENGAGKTGSKASLIAAGYKLRVIDTDKGINTLRSLLTDPRYPYKKIIDAKGIDLNDALDYIAVDIPMSFRRVITKGPDNKIKSDETLLAPTNANAWQHVVDQLLDWQDPPYWMRKKGEPPRRSFGHVQTWGPDVILDFDSFSTLAKMCYYFIQQLNGRLGARDEGYDYQRDIGSTQSQLTRMLEMIGSDAIKCGIILTTHVARLDLSSGAAQSPEQRMRENRPIDAKGFPMAIGRALSPVMGKYFSDTYVVERTGAGANVRRKISTVPTDNIATKNSVYLEREYDVETGLAEIFAALRRQPHPQDLVNAIRSKSATVAPVKAAV